MASTRPWKVCHQQIGNRVHNFFGLGVTNNAAKPDWVVPIEGDGSLYEGHSSGEPIDIKTNETQLSCKQQSCQ